MNSRRSASTSEVTVAREAKRTRLLRELAEQRKWVEEHGGSREGYVERYGSKDDPDYYGDGGEAIYAADYGHLQRLEQALRATR